jgi:hypothetical protein
MPTGPTVAACEPSPALESMPSLFCVQTSGPSRLGCPNGLAPKSRRRPHEAAAGRAWIDRWTSRWKAIRIPKPHRGAHARTCARIAADEWRTADRRGEIHTHVGRIAHGRGDCVDGAVSPIHSRDERRPGLYCLVSTSLRRFDPWSRRERPPLENGTIDTGACGDPATRPRIRAQARWRRRPDSPKQMRGGAA